MPAQKHKFASHCISVPIIVWAVGVLFNDHVQAATRLNGPLVAGGDVELFKITPDGSHVVYQADQQIDERSELFSVPLHGQHIPIKISGDVENTGVKIWGGNFQISEDGQWVVFRAYLTSDPNRIDLLSVQVDGSAPRLNLDGPLFAPFQNYLVEGEFEISPDSERVLFTGAPGHTPFSTPIDGSGPKVQLDAPDRSSTRDQISPEGKYYVWNAWHDHSVYSQPLDGSGPAVKLYDGPGTVRDHQFPITPDGKRIVFTAADGSVSPAHGGYFSTLLDGSGPVVKLSDLHLHNFGRSFGSPVDYQLTPDGRYLVYKFDTEHDNKTELYARPVDGSGPRILLSEANPSGKGPYNHRFQVSPDSDHVIFSLVDAEGVQSLFANSITGNSPPWKLSQTFEVGDLWRPSFSPDGSHVFYGNHVLEPVRTGYQVTPLSACIRPVDGSSPPIELITDPTGPAVIWDYRFAPDGSFVVFSVDNDGHYFGLNEGDSPETHALYAVPTSGGVPRALIRPLADGQRIVDYQIAPDSRSIIYLANQNDPDVFELFSVPVVGLSLAGDYNGDGVVDTADFTAWRMNDGTLAGYEVWRANFGRAATADSIVDSTIPEPHSTWLLLLALMLERVRRHRCRPQHHRRHLVSDLQYAS